MYTQKSFVLKPAEVSKKWYLVDAKDKFVGRIATQIADVLRGKTNPQYTPHTDSGHFVVVVNADKVKFSGKKLDKKKYYRHSGFTGGIKETTAREALSKKPEFILKNAVEGMLPKNSLGRQQLTKLKVYAGESHPHEAQNPEDFNIN